MHVVKYRRILTQQFNGLFKQSGIFFYKEKQAQQAVDWANQTLLALKLAGIV
jgi:catabolite regulation protein CreA